MLPQMYNAKISVFGGDSQVTTKVMGTCGYTAPEYIATGNDIFEQSLEI
jgi:hypothetical protein